MKKALIIFARHPEIGKVKTRLAKTMGDEKALVIYKELLQYTLNIGKKTNATVFVFVAEEKVNNDSEADLLQNFITHLQRGADLGERMKNAFEKTFKEGYTQVCIIGSDCMELTDDLISQAFTSLMNHDVTIGPSKDGGYYLLGMKKLHRPLFEKKSWSTNKVLPETIEDIRTQGSSYFLLSVLSDIDTESDWLQYLHANNQTNPLT